MFEKDDVQLLNDADSLEACNAIEEFYQSAEPDDTLFLYYSGHGRTRNQQLFLCTRNTVAARPYATAIPSSIVNDIISNTLAQVRIIVLDCCYGGMFKGDEVVETLAGEGRYVIAATSATDRAPDSSHRGEASPFTRVFADGLRTEAVDRDNDGTVDLDDLFFYLDSLSFDDLAPKRNYDGSGAVPIARRAVRRVPPSENRPVIPPLETPTLKYDNTPGPSSFLERLAYHASFSPERVSRFRTSMRQDFAESMPEQLTATEFLQRAGVMHDGEITYTGALLFSDSPTLALPSAMVQCAHFKGETKLAPLDTQEIHGPVPDLVVQTRDFVANAARLGEIPTAEGPYAEATYGYPMIAVREIIANAVVHRDYEKHEACVQVHMFTDRIEIVSPGSWEGTDGTVTEKSCLLSQLEQPSRRRNFRLAQILTWSKLVEGVGAGLPRAIADCKAVNAPEPVVTIGNGLVTVTIFPREAGYGQSRSTHTADSGRPRRIVDSPDPRQSLARYLRLLREERWPNVRITQPQLAQALGGKRPLSVPLISSWESASSPKIPPIPRLEAYATFFATERSAAEDPPRMLSPDEMTEPERLARDELLRDLMSLRKEAMRATGTPSSSMDFEALSIGPWRFDDGRPITIVCAQLPPDMLQQMPHTARDDPDFSELYAYADLDSLFELHGHLRAANPTSQINVRTAQRLNPDDYTTHLVSLGGVDWNRAASPLLDQLQLPVRQVANSDSREGEFFEVELNGRTVEYRPRLDNMQGRETLREDVALFARAVNPYNRLRTVSICTGMYSSGSYGAVRALTDARFRDRNAAYLYHRFGSSESFCILTRVVIASGTPLTPDWTVPENRLYEWSR